MSTRTSTDSRRTFLQMQDLIDTCIADIGGNELGRITELLIDRYEGRIAYVRILLDDDGNSRACEVTVPWSSLRVSPHSKSVWQLRAGRSTLGKLQRPDKG